MARAHFVGKARKDNPAVKAGESYYWFKHPYGKKQYSATRPRRSQLTQSSFLSALYDFEDGLPGEIDEDAAQDLMTRLEEMSSECQDSLDNMPEHLQDTSDSGILLTERIEYLDEWAGAIQAIDWDDVTPEEAAQAIEEANPGIS